MRKGAVVKVKNDSTLKDNDLFDHVYTENDIEALVTFAIMKATGVVGEKADWDKQYREITYRVWIPLEITVFAKDDEIKEVK